MNWKRKLLGLGALLFAASATAQTNSTPLFQFGIFYNSLLEFIWCAPMTINGRTHANGDIYIGSAWQLIFNSPVTTTDTISSPAWDGYAVTNYTVAPTFNAGYSTRWSAALLPTGTNSAREIINMPPNGEDPNSALGQQRYYNKAGLILLVSNSTVTLTLKSSPADPQATSVTAYYYPTNSYASNYAQITTNFPFLNITNTFTDQRERDLVKVTDIDVAKLNKWLLTNAAVNAKFPNTSGLYNTDSVPNILYAADNRTYTNSQLTAIRLKNGTTIPTNMVSIVGNYQPSGFTVATSNPLYIWGMFNAPVVAQQGTTNTSGAYPASLVSDALTILSPAWLDSQSATSLGSSKNKATSTTVNAAILTGNVLSTGPAAGQFSGGVQNLPRLLEDWGSGGAVTLTLNTSLVNLFASTRATNQWQSPGVYYQAPVRQFSFDLNFLNPFRLPPGTPLIGPQPPAILTPPQDQTVTAGRTAVWNVSVTGNLPLAYQWLFNSTFIPNATNSALSITNASAGDAGLYSVVVTNAFGSQTSSTAVLAVISPPVIYGQPVNQAAVPGTDVTFSVSAGGTAPLDYQWRFNGSAIAGETSASLLVSSVQSSNIGSYSVTVSNAYGSVNSDAVSLTVYIAPTISAAPRSLTLCVGQDAVFNVGAAGTEPLVYQWQFNGTNLVDATNATLILRRVTIDQAGAYGVTVTNQAGTASTSATCSIYSSAAAVLTVPPSFTANGWQFTITGVPGFNYAVEASTNLVDWVSLATNTSPFTFLDSDAINFPARCYRSVYLP